MHIKKLTVFFLSLWWTAFAAPNQDILGQPPEAIVFKLPNEDFQQWKVVDQNITEKNGLLIYIPSHQNAWADCIKIEYLCNEKLKNVSVDDAIKKYKARRIVKVDKAFENKPSFEVLEKNASDCMFEEILEHEGKPVYVLRRIFLKNGALHSIGIERYSKPWTSAQRTESIKMLKEGVSIERTDQIIADVPMLSFAHKFAVTLDLGQGFKHWEMRNRNLNIHNGWIITWAPHIARELWKEFLYAICFTKTPKTPTLEEFVKDQMKEIEKRAKKQLEFHVLKKSPKEIIYHFVGPVTLFSIKKKIQVNNIVRVIPLEKKYYSFSYESNHQLSQEEIMEWQGRLEGISVATK